MIMPASLSQADLISRKRGGMYDYVLMSEMQDMKKESE